MRKKPGILFDVYMKENWIGGVYYTRSIIYSCTLNDAIMSKFELIVVVNEKTKKLFDLLKDKVTLIEIYDTNKWIRSAKIYHIVKKYKVRWYYDLPQGKQGKPFKKIGIYWIPDLQHVRYPQFFGEEELKKRKKVFGDIAKSDSWLVLSSRDSLDDFKKEYPEYRCKVKVVHFVSYLDNELLQITEEMDNDIIRKYDLDKPYIYIPNQFWQHKNHIVVLKAIKILAEKDELKEYRFVFTGELRDHRNRGYYIKLKSIMEDKQIQERIKVLGFIDRAEQLVVMEHAALLVQPSLFEGWGTVVEDAKVFGKTIVLSNIPVHQEQRDDRCYLFDAEDPDDLIDKIKSAIDRREEESLERGLDLAKKNAFIYSKRLEEIFNGE